MPGQQYTYDVLIRTQYDNSGVKKGTDAQTDNFNALQKAEVQHRNRLEQIQQQHYNKAAQEAVKHGNKLAQIEEQKIGKIVSIEKQSQSKLLQLETQHQNKILEINRKQSNEKEKLFIKETQAFESHKRKLELIEAKSNARLNQISSRGNTNYQSTTTFEGLRTGVAGVTTAVSTAIQSLDLLFGHVRSGAETIFSFAKSASDAGSQIFEMSQQTGLSAETVSSLKFAADQTNVGIESLIGGVSKFERTLAEASRGNDKAVDSLKRLGIDPKKGIDDLEGSLSKAFKVINDAPPGVKQTSAALDVFGKSGAALIPIIKQADGDIEKLKKTAAELGVQFSTEQAKAADDFGDALTVLQTQLRGTAFVFGREFIPPILEGIQDFSLYLRDNQQVIREWAKDSADVLRGLRGAYESEVGQMIRYVISLGLEQSIVGQLFGLAKDYGASKRPTPVVVDPYAPGGIMRNGGVDLYGPGGTMRGGSASLVNNARQDYLNRTGGMSGYDMSAGGGGGSVKKKSKKEYIDGLIATASARYGVDPDLISAIIGQESKFNTGAVSNKGAGGLMQLMPGTAKDLGVTNRFNASQNINAGVKYFAGLLKEFNGDVILALAAYNAGPGAVKKYGGVPPFSETQDYVRKITSGYASKKSGSVGTGLDVYLDLLKLQQQAIVDATRLRYAMSKDMQDRLNNPEKYPELLFQSRDRYALSPDAQRRLNPEKMGYSESRDRRANESYFDRNLRETNRQLANDLEASQNAVALAAETASERYKIAWQDALNDVWFASDAANLSMIQSQVKLADSTVYHANQANASVLEFLASQRSVTDVIADAKINVIQGTYDLIDKGLDRVTSKLGAVGNIIKDLISGFARLALNRFFQSIFGGGGIGQGGTPNFNPNSGGGFLQNILSAVTGGNRGASTPGFNPGYFTGGAYTIGNGQLPFGLSDIAQAATRPRVYGQQNRLGSLFNLSGIGSQLSALAPLLGLTAGAGIGASLGQGNPLASVIGAVGLGGVGAVAGSAIPAILNGSFAGLTALGGVTLGAGAALAVAAYFIGRNSRRRKEEGIRNQAMLDAFSSIDNLIKDVKADRIDGTSALSQAEQIRSQYLQEMSQLKDKKTRNHALADVHRIDVKINTLRAEIDAQRTRQTRHAAIVPTFASGGYVGAYNGLIPGAYDRRDDRLIRVSGNEVVLNPNQWKPIAPYLQAIRVPNVKAYADGGHTGSNASSGAAMAATLAGKIHVEVHNHTDRTETAISYIDESGMKHLVEKVSSAMAKDIDQKRDSHPVVRASERATGRARA